VILVYVRIQSWESPKESYGPIFDNGGVDYGMDY
jgi:hypothetical protein